MRYDAASLLGQFDMPDRDLYLLFALMFGLPGAIGTGCCLSFVFRKNVKTGEAFALAVYWFVCCIVWAVLVNSA